MVKEFQGICFICGTKIMVDDEFPKQLCKNDECMQKFGNQFECPECGTPAREFIKTGGISMGRATLWKITCPSHEKISFKIFTYCSDTAKCPKCKNEVVGEIGLEFLKDEGSCLSCDKITGEATVSRDDILAENENVD